MHKNKEHINVVWFKRDLRLQDNEAIANALNSNKRTLLLYVFENILLNDDHEIFKNVYWYLRRNSLSNFQYYD